MKKHLSHLVTLAVVAIACQAKALPFSCISKEVKQECFGYKMSVTADLEKGTFSTQEFVSSSTCVRWAPFFGERFGKFHEAWGAILVFQESDSAIIGVMSPRNKDSRIVYGRINEYEFDSCERP